MAEKLLTPEEAAAALTISPKTMRDWLRAGKIKGVKVGRLWRIREQDLNTFITDLDVVAPGGASNEDK